MDMVMAMWTMASWCWGQGLVVTDAAAVLTVRTVDLARPQS